MGITIHKDMVQGDLDWLQARCGILTASEMKLIVTEKTMKAASNDKERAHLYELMAQRITRYVEPQYVSEDMLRGHEDEVKAKAVYSEHYAPVDDVGFITNDKWGFTIGYSPDGLVGESGLVECKSRRQKYQIQTVIEHVTASTVPTEYAIQLQTGMAVAERQWLDFISYSGGLPMCVIRVHPDPVVQDAIVNIAGEFERRLDEKLAIYHETVAARRMIPTERTVIQEMYV